VFPTESPSPSETRRIKGRGIFLREKLASVDGRPSGSELCEHPFVASQGSAYTRLRRALDHSNLTEALSAASELQHVGLLEALELCLLLCDKAPERFNRAALRWHGRYCREVADVSLPEAQAILATLAALPLPSVRPRAASALSDLLCRRGLERAGEALTRWAS
jgi:hypothetical protein